MFNNEYGVLFYLYFPYIDLNRLEKNFGSVFFAFRLVLFSLCSPLKKISFSVFLG